MNQAVQAMRKYRYVALHTVVAAAFIFTLQRFAFGATLETSLLWAIVFGIMAAGLAVMQANR
ncbi:MAG: hypothetical protein EPO23_02025 [Xanthobacteraceae bacterium]|nr:MAG: hypothetical protein EPO23_02025 [Xanthobacteraceae bacterium]